jgi:hypothetical protein
MNREATIRRAVLEILSLANPYALPEAQLRIEVNGLIRPPAKPPEFAEALDFLTSRRAIHTVPEDLSPETMKWAITEIGQVLVCR